MEYVHMFRAYAYVQSIEPIALSSGETTSFTHARHQHEQIK